MQIYVLIAKVSYLVFVYKILLTSLSIKGFFNMIKNFVVGCFFKASLSRLAANRLSSSAKTLAKSSVSYYENLLSHSSSCSPSFFFFVWLLASFMKNLLALCCLCFHVEDNILCMITKTQVM